MARREAQAPQAPQEEHDEDGAAGAFLDSLPDDDDDDDDDDGDDDDDPSGEGEPVQLPNAASAPSVPLASARVEAPPLPRRPPSRGPRDDEDGPPRSRGGVRGPRNLSPQERASSPTLNRARAIQETAYQEIDGLLASLNFADREYEIRVDRLEPSFDENDVPCDGHLHTFREKVSLSDIQRRFGGGLYLIRIFGPHPTTGRPGIIKQEKFKIAGAPHPMKVKKRDDDHQKPNEVGEVVRVIAESNERAQERIEKLIERTSNRPSALDEIMPVLAPVLKPLVEKLTSTDDSLKALMEMQREERRAEEARRAEERRAEEERRREEREERRREEDRRREEERRREDERREEAKREEERRREALREEREREREEREKERERLREERERERERAREEAAERQRQHERDLQAARERSEQDAKRQQEHMTMMQTMMNTQLQMIEQRAETGGIKGLAEQMIMLKKLQGSLTGEDDEPSTLDKISEVAERITQVVLPATMQIRGAVQGRQQAPQAPPQPVLVDLGPKRAALPNPQPQQAPQAQAQPQQAPQPEATAPAPQAVEAASEENDFKEFVFPVEGDEMIMVGTKLIKNIDLAVQKSMSADDVVQKILVPFDQAAPLLLSMALGMDEDQLMQFIEGNVPAHWAILTPKGEEIVLDAFEKFQSIKQGGA